MLVGSRFVLSARAQAVLKTIFEDIMEETLQKAKKIAEAAGKERVSLDEVEKALKKLCDRYILESIQAQNANASKIIPKSKP